MFNIADDDNNADDDDAPNDDMGTVSTSDTLPTSPSDSLETALEARALASAIQRPKLQRKKIGRWPAKLSDLSSVPSRKPTAPTLFSGWKESLAPSRPPDPGNCSADSAPT